MSAAVLTRPAAAVCGTCHGAGGVFRGGRFPESCPDGCPPRNVGGCLSCGCSPSSCGSASGCGCTCCCSYEPAFAPQIGGVR